MITTLLLEVIESSFRHRCVRTADSVIYKNNYYIES